MRVASLSLVALTVLSTAAVPARAEEAADRATYERAVRWLLSQQHENGGFGALPGQPPGEVGITSIVTKALAEVPGELRQEARGAVDRAVAFILSTQQEDGSFVQRGSGIPTYRTSVAIMALVAADRAQHAAAIARGAEWLRGAQMDEGEQIAVEDVRHGGFWYGPAGEGGGRSRGRGGRSGADLSNTHMALAALRDAGIAEDDPVFQRAVTFLRRCQNSSETNDGVGFRPADDGGFVYDPVVAPDQRDQAPPSYAGMTYAGLLSLVYAGVSRDDPSVRAALGWIERHYTLDENHGLGRPGSGRGPQAGLYYYYYTFAKCLRLLGDSTLRTAEGERRWARDLFDALQARQREDGSFVNADGTWWESDPVLVTAYSVSAMNFARGHLAGGVGADGR